jgi:hypothetical protein
MKNIMSCLSNHYDRWDGKRLIRLLALLLALAVSTPVLLAEDQDHDRDRDHGPDLTGVWTQTYADNQHLALVTFNRDGTASFDSQGDIVFDPAQSQAHGLWKQTGVRTFIATFKLLEYNRSSDASLYGTVIL